MGEKHESSGSPRAGGTAGTARSRRRDDNPQVRYLRHRPASHDPRATPGREVMDHAGQASGREAVGEAFAVAVSMIFGQAETGLHTLKAILLATLGWESRRDI